MQVRKLLEKYKPVVAVVAILFIAGAIVKIVVLDNRPLKPEPLPPSTAWFYDIATGELTVKADNIPSAPELINGPASGQARAYIYSCTSCEEPASRVTAYLESFTSEAQESLRSAGLNSYSLMEAEPSSQIATLIGPVGRFVAAPAGAGKPLKWQPIGSREGQEIMQTFTRAKCGPNQVFHICNK